MNVLPFSSRADVLVAGDGRRLAAMLFTPEAPKAAAVMAGGVGIAKEYYFGFAKFLAEAGYAVLCFDFRGIGGSLEPDVASDPARMQDWGLLDLPAAIDALRRWFPALPLVMVGHSAGAQTLGLAANNAEVRGCLGVAGQHGYWRHWDEPSRRRAWMLSHVLIPEHTAEGSYFPGRQYQLADLPRGVAQDWALWCRTPNYVVGAFAERGMREWFQQYTGELHLLSFEDDVELAPKRSVDALAELYPNARIARHHVLLAECEGRTIGHFGFFRPLFRKTLWAEGQAFLDRVVAAAAHEDAGPRTRASD